MSLLLAERGVQLPSASLVPSSAVSDGDDALFLASSYGLTADPWQESTVRAWLCRRPDRKWSAPRCGLAVARQNGKNAALEIRELFGMVALAERFLHTAHEVKTARKAFLRLCSFFENEREFPELAALVKEIRKTNGQEAIVLHNGGSVEFIARSKSSGRGFSVDVLILDEAQEASDEALAALLPTVSASSNPQLILTGTPPGPKVNGEVFTRMRRAGLAGDERRLCWLEWSCPADADLDDRGSWARANPNLGVRLHHETIADERATMDDETFARERLGVWDEDAAGVFDLAAWADLDVGAEPDRPSPVALAVVVSSDRKWAHIALAGTRSDGKRHLQVVASGRGTNWVAERVAALHASWLPVGVAVDPGSPAGSLIPELEAVKVEPVLVTGRDRGQAVGMFLDGFEEKTLSHQSQDVLGIALEHAVLRDVGEARVWDHRVEGVDISPIQAVSLALFVLVTVKPTKRSGAIW